MNIVLLESLAISDDKLQELIAPFISAGHTFKAFPRTTDIPTLISEAEDADVLIIANMPLRGEVISACKHLKFIDVAFTGVDHVDLKAAAAKGVKVSNASGYSNEAVAELVIGQMLSLLRNTQKLDPITRKSGTKDGLVGSELGSRKVGVVGAGAIGKRVIEILKVFGADVITYNRNPKNIDGVKDVTLDELLSESDIVTLHCPLNDSTKGLISAEKIALMKKDALLINMSRGPVLDSNALADALNNGKIAGAAIDVFETEPPLDPSHPLLSAKNCIVTPHVAFATKESMQLRAKIVFNSLQSWMDGNQVNIIL